jgi:hypothetical protein
VVRRKQKKQLEKLKKRLGHSYSLLVIVFALVVIAAIDWAVIRNREDSAVAETETAALPSPAQAVLQEDPWNFFHPTWRTDDAWSPFNNEAGDIARLPTPNIDVSMYLNDPENKIDAQFAVPPSMKKRVLFWMEVYSKYSSRFKIVHDRDEPGIIYGLIDLRPLYRVLPNNQMADAKANEIEKKILSSLKTKLSEAIGTPSKANALNAQERNQIRGFLSQAGALGPKETQRLIENIRSQTGQRDMFLQALSRASNLLPHIETVLRRKNLPVALARIPFVESSFNVKALSSVGAVGIWQFMPETARQMIHSEEDKMWSDPLKQTASAAKLFQIYRSMLPDWGTTVTSYNSGVGRVKGLCKKYRVKGVEGLLNIPTPDGLGFAGQNFYSEFLAANLVEAYKENIFSKLLSPIDPALVFKGVQPFPKELCDL